MPDKLKILCLHGYRQNKDVFKAKLGAFRKLFKNDVDFHFLNAPHIVVNSSNNGTDERSWWFINDNKLFDSRVNADQCIGFEDSIRVLKTCVENEGPFDGFLGFSQGAAFLAIVAAMKQLQQFVPEIGFIILISGFKSKNTSHAKYYTTKIPIPSLHIIGKCDEVIDKSRSEELYEIFESETAEILFHDGGHYVPARRNLKNAYSSFIIKYSALKEL